MSETVTITIDGTDYQVNAGINLLQACLSLKLDMPYFCWHPAMGSAGSCRQCAIIQYQNAEDTRGRLVMSCMTEVTDGMRVSMDNTRAKGFRATAIEALMTNHPHDCPVCEEGGDCHLQDMTLMSGHISRQYPGGKRTHYNQYLGPLLNHEMNRCIGCYRCVRFYRDYAGGDDLNVFASANRIYFGRVESGILDSHFSGNLAEVCPTGVFTDKPFSNHYIRKWDLATSPTICNQCGLGCNTYTSERNGIVRRVNNRLNSSVNGHFLCDKGRFGYEHINHNERIDFAIARGTSVAEPVVKLSQDEAQKQLYKYLDEEEIVVVGSGRSSIENNAALVKLVGRRNFYTAMTDKQMSQLKLLVDWYSNNDIEPASMQQVEQSDAMLIVGEDICHTAPRLALSVRQMSRNAGIEQAAKLGVKQWQSEAVSNIAQDTRSPVHVLNSLTSALDDISRPRKLMSANEQHAFLIEIEHKLRDANTLVGELATKIANDLINAKKPCVITGTHQQSTPLLKTCIRIADLLRRQNSNATFHCTTEQANHLALALFCDDKINIRAMSALAKRLEKHPPTTLLIMEADLYRYFDGEQLGKLLDKVKHIVVLDHLLTPTGQMADLICPVTTFAESHGHWVNSEGRLQYNYAVMNPIKARQHGFKWLRHLTELKTLADVQRWVVKCYPLLKAIQADMHADIEDLHGDFTLAREPLRSSARTAINSNVDVKEYPPNIDDDSSLNFSMEGVSAHRQSLLDDNPAPVTGVWSPKWNSGQGVNQHLDNQTHESGYRLFNFNHNNPIAELEIDESVAEPCENTICIDVKHHIYANQELTEYTKAIKELTPKATAAISPMLAKQLNLNTGDELVLVSEIGRCRLPCEITEVADNVIAIDWVYYCQLTEQLPIGASIELCSNTHTLAHLMLNPSTSTQDQGGPNE